MFDITLRLVAPAGPASSPSSVDAVDSSSEGSLGGSESGSGSGSGVLKSSTVVLRRDYQEFRALHLALTSLFSSTGGKVGRSGVAF